MELVRAFKMIGIKELIKRPIIRDDKPYEFMNKLTDDELNEWEKRIFEAIKKEGVEHHMTSVSYVSKCIDTDLLYTLFKSSI